MAEKLKALFGPENIQFETYQEGLGYVHQITPAQFSLTVDQEYVIECDGDSFPCTAIPYDSFAPGAVLLQNESCPVLAGYLASTDYVAFCTAESGEHTVAIYLSEASDENEHPDETVILPEGAVAFAPGVNGLGEPIYTTTFLEFELVRWRKYRVSWEGEETVLMAYPGPNGVVCLGNLFITGSGENTGERFLIVYGDGYSNIATYEAGESREVAIWLTNEVGIVLQDYTEAERAYYDIDRLRVDTTDGNTVEYIHDSLVPETVEKTVELDFSDGVPMTVTPGAGQAFSLVHIPVPKGLAPDNIAEGVRIAGVEGNLKAGAANGVEYTLNDDGEIIKAKIVGSIFCGCAGLEFLEEIDASGVQGCTTVLRYAVYSTKALTSVAVPDGVTTILNNAITANTALTSVTLPSTLESIGNYGIYSNKVLNNVVIPASVKSIGQFAFFGNAAMTNVIFENPNGWWYADSATATSGTTIPSSDLSNPATAATHLKSTYYSKFWFRT